MKKANATPEKRQFVEQEKASDLDKGSGMESDG